MHALNRTEKKEKISFQSLGSAKEKGEEEKQEETGRGTGKET